MTNIFKLINNNDWTKIYKQLVSDKISPTDELPNGNTIIHMASINNNKKIISYYLKNNINPLLKSNINGNTPIHLLATYIYTDTLKKCITTYPDFLTLLNNDNESISNILYNNLDLIKFMCSFKINLITDDTNGNNILTKNIDDTNKLNDNNYKIIKLLLKSQSKFIEDNPTSFLCYAINQNKPEIAKLLIENGYDINKKDKSFLTPLIYSIQNKQNDVFSMLLDKKVIIDYNGAEGDDNPMIYAVKNSNEYVIELLLKHNFNVTNYDRRIETPLHYALANKSLSIETLTKLIYYSDLNIQNVYGQTPLHLLCKYHDLNNYNYVLSNKKMDIFIKDSAKKRPIDYLNGHTINNFLNLVVKNYGQQLTDKNYSYILGNIIKCKNNVKSDECNHELKKYMFATERSIPVLQDKLNMKMKFIDGKQINHGLFNADAFHNMIYTIIILQKYKNVCIPFQYFINDKRINFKMSNKNLYNFTSEKMVYELSNIYNDYFHEIHPYLLIWKNKDVNFIHKDFKFLMKKCLLSNKIRFIFIKLTLIPSASGTHANILIYDKVKNVLERFEPYGIIPYIDSNNLDLFIEKLGVECINKNVKYVKPSDMFDTLGPQVISNDSDYNIKKLGDPNGYCLAWTLWFLEIRVNNPDISAKEIMKNNLGNIVKSNSVNGDKLFINFIRNYAAELDSLKNNFMINANIDPKSIYDLNMGNSNMNKLMRKLKGEFGRIVDERV